MPRKVITVTHPDGTKKVIVGKQSTSQPNFVNTSKPIVTKESDEDRRPKPGTPAVGLTKQRNGYKHGGKIKFKTS